MPACLLLLIGLPGSGKTTLARRLRSALSPSHRVIHVEYDAAVDLAEQARFQAAAATGEGNEGWRTARRELEQAVEAAVTGDQILERFQKAVNLSDDGMTRDSEATDIQRPTVFIIDDNMYLRSMRYRYFQLARRHQLGFASVLLDVPFAECFRRNSERARPVPEAAIEAMARRLERPELDRIWEARSVTLGGGLTHRGGSVDLEREGVSGDLKSVFRDSGRVRSDEDLPLVDPVSVVSDLVAVALRSPVAPLVDNTLEAEASRLVCSASHLHQLDRQLRQLVGEYAAGSSDRAKAANSARQRVMGRVKAGEIALGVGPEEGERFAEAARRLFEAVLAGGGSE